MKKLLLIFFPIFFFSQNRHYQAEEVFEEYMKKADSMGYRSDSLVYRLDLINKIDFYKDKLLIADNYKDKSKAYDIINSYNKLIKSNFDYEIITKSDVIINKFFNIQKGLLKAKVSREIIEYYYDKKMEIISNKILKDQEALNFNENRIIMVLQKANYSIEKYNILTSEEKIKLIKQLEKK